MKKRYILVVFGGPSTEYEISCSSAASVIGGIDLDKYNIYCVGIKKNGIWVLTSNNISNINDGSWENDIKNKQIILSNDPNKKGFYILNHDKTFNFCNIDIIYPIIHGKIGEDGIIQGFAELMDIPIVSTDLFTSICSYDKYRMNKILEGIDIKIPKGLYVNNLLYDSSKIIPELIKKDLNFPLIVKPSKGGSSIGISLVNNNDELIIAIQNAFKYDKNILIEEQIKGSEIKIGIFGVGRNLHFSEISQVYVHGTGFEDYNCKYISHNTTRYLPAKIDEQIKNKILEISKKIYQEMDFKIYARIDFFLSLDNVLYFNEINTIPGFTRFCSYPQMYSAMGMTYEELIDKLISLSFETHNK